MREEISKETLLLVLSALLVAILFTSIWVSRFMTSATPNFDDAQWVFEQVVQELV